MIAPNPDTPHPPSQACGEQHCHIHNVDEPDGALGCAECGHSYATWTDVVIEWLKHHPDVGPDTKLPDTPYSISFCQVCGHDF